MIKGIFNIPTTTQLGTYSGTPTFTHRRNVQSYQYLIDKIHRRIEGWQSKFLSIAGRATLIEFTTSAISIYAMQTAIIPQKIRKDIDRMNRNFLCGDTSYHKSCHTIGWDMITRPKET